MSETPFIPGQRWVSNTESELGLGIVLDTAHRRVNISFPAAGESRVYAIDNAPLSRIEYTVGEQITSADGDILVVDDRELINGLIVYKGVSEQGEARVIAEIDLDSFVHFNKPQDRLFAGQVDKLSSFKLRVDTLEHLHRHQQSDIYGLLGPRVQLLQHQFFIARQVASRFAPRVLLADEVGLGKTIEAGLIIHQQLFSGRAARVLVVVPDSLVHQWLVEMLRRFNLHFSIMDEERCAELRFSGEKNPFETAQLVICSLSSLTRSERMLEWVQQADWDLMVVDEAHHLTWSAEQASDAYLHIESLARQIPGVLLLTATPEQLGVESHFARLRLLDPDRYYDLQEFLAEEASYQPINHLVQGLLEVSSDDLLIDSLLAEGSELSSQLEAYLGQGGLDEFKDQLDQAVGDEETSRSVVNAIIFRLLDHHGTGRVLFRNTRSAVEGFPERELHPHPLSQPEAYWHVQARAESDLELLCRPEGVFGNDWLKQDPRVGWLVSWLKDNHAAADRNSKVLVICASADTAQSLEEYLRLREGIRTAVFHEGLSLVARDRAAAYFAEPEEGAQILICSEIGSEGRNFQFAHQLVLFDLPINPDLLEQRIGRLDRIGQTRNVEIHVPYYESSAQEALLNWLHDGVDAFLTASPAGQTLFEEFGDRLKACLTQTGDEVVLSQLIEDTSARNQQLLTAMSEGRDRLLEINSCNAEQAMEILDQVVEASNPLELASYMERVFDQFGVDQQQHSSQAMVLTPGDHMHHHSFPGLNEDGMTVTYSRNQALHREDMQFMSWEHPMVSGSMEMIATGDFGNTALCTIKLPPIKPGTLMVEAIFTLNCPAPKALQVSRYLQQSNLRVLLDSDGNDLSKVIGFTPLNKLAQRVPRGKAPDIIKHAREEIAVLIDKADDLAQAQRADLVDASVEKMVTLQQIEIDRLKALAAVNPNIRQAEIDHLVKTQDDLCNYLQSAKLRLDAIRIVVAT